MAGKIQRVFLNVNMANRFDGLQKLVHDSGIKLSELTPDSYLVFVNSGRDKIAMLVGPQTAKQRQIIAYVKLESGRKVDLRVIAQIPRAFNGSKIDYDKALEFALEESLKNKKKHKSIEML